MRDIYTWLGIVLVVATSTAGDLTISHAMKRVGDVGTLWRRLGIILVLKRMASNGLLWLGVTFMALAFFSLLFALSWADVSLVAPAAASLTFISNAAFGRFILHEQVDGRRWIAALLVAGGVALVAV